MLFNVFYYRMQNKLANIISFYIFLMKKQNIYLKIIKLILFQKKNFKREGNFAIDKSKK